MPDHISTPPHAMPAAVFTRQGDVWHPTSLSSGPWDPQAQHGGAPAALLVHIAETAMADPAWQLSRLTLELIKPVPVAPLTVEQQLQQSGRSTARLTCDVYAGDVLVARAHALMVRGEAFAPPAAIPGWSPEQLLPLPDDCQESLQIPGMKKNLSFYHAAMDHRMAQGDASGPGPAATWFRLTVPLVEGQPTSPAMRAAAAADFGSGVSWVLSAEHYLFSNADLSLHLHRAPQGEWIGLLAETHIDAGGIGTAFSRLYDSKGLVGVAAQTLVLRQRRAPG